MEVNYKGSFLNKLLLAVDRNPEMTMGEILYSFLHKSNLKGKHFFYCTDIELYNSLENFTKIGVETEEPVSTNEFEFWIENVKYGTK